MDPMSLNNAIPTVTEVDPHIGAPPTVRSRSSSPSRVTRGHVEKGESLPSKAKESTTTYPPHNPNGHTTTGPEVPQPFSSGGAAIVEPRSGRTKERTTFTEKVGNLFKSKSRGRSRSKSRSRAVDGTLNPTVA